MGFASLVLSSSTYCLALATIAACCTSHQAAGLKLGGWLLNCRLRLALAAIPACVYNPGCLRPTTVEVSAGVAWMAAALLRHARRYLAPLLPFLGPTPMWQLGPPPSPAHKELTYLVPACASPGGLLR